MALGRKRTLLLSVVLFFAMLLCLHQAMYYGWLTATPLSEDGRKVVEQRYVLFAILSLLIFITFISSIVRLVILAVKNRRRQVS